MRETRSWNVNQSANIPGEDREAGDGQQEGEGEVQQAGAQHRQPEGRRECQQSHQLLLQNAGLRLRSGQLKSLSLFMISSLIFSWFLTKHLTRNTNTNLLQTQTQLCSDLTCLLTDSQFSRRRSSTASLTRRSAWPASSLSWCSPSPRSAGRISGLVKVRLVVRILTVTHIFTL